MSAIRVRVLAEGMGVLTPPIRLGDIITTRKLNNQLAEMPMAVPLALAWSGRISGTYLRRGCQHSCIESEFPEEDTYTQGMQLAVDPKINMYVKKNATLASAVLSCVAWLYCGLPKLSKTLSICDSMC